MGVLNSFCPDGGGIRSLKKLLRGGGGGGQAWN